MSLSPGRNDSCPCESGEKYKRCCLRWHQRAAAARRDTRRMIAERGEVLDYAEEVAAIVLDIIQSLDAGEHDEAGALACDLLEDYPQEAEGMEMLGHVHAALGERPQAMTWYRKALAVVRCVYAPGQCRDLHERWIHRALVAVEQEGHRTPWILSLEDRRSDGIGRD
jgi:hypothetical protein